MTNFDGGIEIDQSQTWPKDLLQLLDGSLGVLRDYEIRRASIDRLCEQDILARINPPPNDFELLRDQVVEKADTLLRDKDILGFHCTRLTENEEAAILAGGLEPLSQDLLERRVSQCVVDGRMSLAMAEMMLAKHQADGEDRRGMYWSVFSRRILREEDAVCRLFRSWGGEALYRAYEKHEEVGPALRSIGRPCIAITATPASEIQCYGSIGERFVTTFLDTHNVESDQSPLFEGHVRHVVKPQAVKRLIFHGEAAFEELTNCSGWEDIL